MTALCDELQSMWHKQIPISAAMGIEIVRFADDELIVRAALAPNINVHGSAFAGSLYAICALTGWGMTWLKLRSSGLDGRIVIAEGQIRYRRAVAEDILCTCRFDHSEHAANLAAVTQSGSGSFPLVCTIAADGRPAVRFEGVYAVRTGG